MCETIQNTGYPQKKTREKHTSGLRIKIHFPMRTTEISSKTGRGALVAFGGGLEQAGVCKE